MLKHNVRARLAMAMCILPVCDIKLLLLIITICLHIVVMLLLRCADAKTRGAAAKGRLPSPAQRG